MDKETLRAVLHGAPPPPNDAAKRRAINAAIAAFETEYKIKISTKVAPGSVVSWARSTARSGDDR